MSPPFVTAGQLASTPLPPLDWVLESLLPRGARMVFYGAWGTAKSWWLLGLGLHVAAGQPYQGFHVAQPLKVLYLNEEMALRTVHSRVQRLVQGHSLDCGDRWVHYSWSGFQASAEGVEELLKLCVSRGFAPDLIIVETFRRTFTGNENDSGDVARWWRAWLPLLVPQVTLVVSHHTRKPNPLAPGAVRDTARGSGEIMAGPDCAVAISSHPERASHYLLTHVKSRDVPEVKPWWGVLEAPADEAQPARWSRMDYGTLA